jgi:hypothetical protein
MKRRIFLKNLFGAAVVAAIPKPIFEEMVRTPLPEKLVFVPDRLHEADEPGHVLPPNKYLYLYDDKKFIGSSCDFNISMSQDYITIPKAKRVKIGSRYHWMEDYFAPPEHFPTTREWTLKADYISWNILPDDIDRNDKLNFIATVGDKTLIGDIYISAFATQAGYDSPIRYAAEFYGTGPLVIN